MAKKNKKDRLGIVYSTENNYNYDYDDEQVETLPISEQKLKVQLDNKGRGGKKVTLVTGFVGSQDDLKDLGKTLKAACGVGGSAKDGEIIIQGEVRDKVVNKLKQLGYTVK